MKNSQVSIVLRVRNADSTRSHYPAATTANGRLKPLVGLVKGKSAHLPNASYYLRYRQPGPNGTKRVWEAVGTDPVLAMTARLKRQHLLEGMRIGVSAPEPTPVTDTQPPTDRNAARGNLGLEEAIETYVMWAERKLINKRARRRKDSSGQAVIVSKLIEAKAKRSANSFLLRLTEFRKAITAKLVKDVAVDDIQEYIMWLGEAGKAEKTVVVLLPRWPGSTDGPQSTDALLRVCR